MRFVAARPSLSAASIASVPVLVKSTRSRRGGVRASNASASRPGSAVTPSCTAPAARARATRRARRGCAGCSGRRCTSRSRRACRGSGCRRRRRGTRRRRAHVRSKPIVRSNADELRVDRARPAIVLVPGAGEQALEVDRAHALNLRDRCADRELGAFEVHVEHVGGAADERERCSVSRSRRAR